MCWLWKGAISRGYGRLYCKGNPKYVLAHRFSYEHFVGKIPSDKVIDHICRVKNCVRPEHLRVLSSVENTLLGISFTAINARKIRCNKGHEFNETNTYQAKLQRGCRKCRKRSSLLSKRRRFLKKLLAKLDPKTIPEMRKLRAAGFTYAEIGKKYHLGWGSVRKVCLEKNWDQIETPKDEGSK